MVQPIHRWQLVLYVSNTHHTAQRHQPATSVQEASFFISTISSSETASSKWIPHLSSVLHTTVAKASCEPKTMTRSSPGGGRSRPSICAPSVERSETMMERERA